MKPTPWIAAALAVMCSLAFGCAQQPTSSHSEVWKNDPNVQGNVSGGGGGGGGGK
jgi:hypothetical protein